MQLVFKAGLEIYGFEVVTAANGLEALTQFKANDGKYDAIVTDNDMPKMNGLEFVRAIRDIEYKGRIFVVSGNLGVEELRAYKAYEISGFFQKPFETALFATMLLQN